MGFISIISAAPIVVAVIAVGVVTLAFGLLIWETRRNVRRPFSGRPLRPPGESLRLRVEMLNEQLLTRLLLLSVALIPMMLVCEAALRRGDHERLNGAVAGGTALMLGIVLWAWRTAKRLKNCALGFDGERAVGEELNRLMLDGCLVFHDLSLENRGNVDHVVVAPHAVFAVETKARRKRKPERADQEDYKVAYTGKELVFPFGRGTKELEQARKTATALAGRLGRLIREDIAVLPVLVLPGWFIERTGRGEVIVVNDSPKQLRGAMLDARARPLPAHLREQIIAQLDEWSRQSMDR